MADPQPKVPCPETPLVVSPPTGAATGDYTGRIGSWLEDTSMAERGETSLVVCALWMIGISLLLFFLPALNGLIGGAVGGYKAGSAMRGLTAAILPAIVSGIGIWILLGIFDAPILGFLAGLAVGVWALISSIGLLIGAAIGGAASPGASTAAT